MEIQQPSNNVESGLAIANTSRQRSLRLWVDAANNSRIDSGAAGTAPLLLNGAGSGRVGVGLESPGNPLDVEAAAGTAKGGVVGFNEVLARVGRTSGGHAALSIDAPSGQDAVLYLAENGSARWALRHDASQANELDIRFDAQQLLQLTTNGDLFVSGAFNPPSDRNLKQEFAPVDAAQVLAQVTAIPIQTWAYKSAPDTRHLGPVAQDFRAAFGLGTDDKHIATVDADGVALAAIQGLDQKVENGKQKSESRMAQLETENAELQRRLGDLEQLVNRLTQAQTTSDSQN